ncbi:MAG: galactokinase [Rothia sp. (in: high G+C Gram-positive bacteria)]|nr:galactokinase [Rothia sp. (in: high G+C Gram-positive bacteria)]
MIPVWKKTQEPAVLISNAVQAFTAAFGDEPSAVYSAPGRVNLLGEHIDYSGGTVLPFALPQRTYIAVAPRADGVIRAITAQGDAGATASQAPRQIALKDIAPGAIDGWLAYVAGVPWAMIQEGLVTAHSLPGADIAIDSSVPLGAGLSSSAALECSVALAFDAFAAAVGGGEPLAATDAGRAQLATACIRAENEIAGANTGGMDQSISLRAQEGAVLAIDCRDFSTRPLTVDLASAGLALLVIDTRAHHNLSGGQYAKRRAACDFTAEALGVSTLRDFFEGTPTLKEAEHLVARWEALVASGEIALPPETDVATARAALHHAFTEIARVEECLVLFESGTPTKETWAQLGQLLNVSHDSLRDDYRVSCEELDVAVDAARAAGALGARMTGGGFGGSAIALVAESDVSVVAEAVAAAYEQAGFDHPEFLLATPGPAAAQDR